MLLLKWIPSWHRVNIIMTSKKYMVLLVDRQRVKIFSIINGAVEDMREFEDDQVPKKVKHGDDTWDAQDKIFRHIEDHLHKHLVKAAGHAFDFAKENHVWAIIIGGHKPLFSKIEKHLAYPLSNKVKGTFVTELKSPFNEILKRAKSTVDKIEKGEK